MRGVCCHFKVGGAGPLSEESAITLRSLKVGGAGLIKERKQKTVRMEHVHSNLIYEETDKSKKCYFYKCCHGHSMVLKVFLSLCKVTRYFVHLDTAKLTNILLTRHVGHFLALGAHAVHIAVCPHGEKRTLAGESHK